MIYGIQSIHQTDWQGRVELSDQPRTNYVRNSEDMTSGVGIHPSNSIPVATSKTWGPHPFFEVTTVGSPPNSYFGVEAGVMPAVDVSACFALLAGTSDVMSDIQLRGIGGGHYLRGKIQVLSGPGQTDGSQVTGLSSTDPTVIYCEDSAGGEHNTGYLFLYTPESGQTLLVAGLSVYDFHAGSKRAYIPTTSAPVTVTDYTADNHGIVHVGDPEPSGAVLDWSGSGFAGKDPIQADAVEFGTKDGATVEFQLVGPNGRDITDIHSGWPSTLPCPLSPGESQYAPFTSNVISSSMATGAPKRRRRFTAVPETFSTQVILNAAQVQTLQTFVKDTLQDVLPFLWQDFRTGDLAVYVFQQRPTYSHVEGSKRLWVAQLELRTVP